MSSVCSKRRDSNYYYKIVCEMRFVYEMVHLLEHEMTLDGRVVAAIQSTLYMLSPCDDKEKNKSS